jgi:hypothetical protein
MRMKGNRMKGKRIFACLCLAAGLFPLSLGAEEGPLSWTRAIDWEKGELTLTIEAPLAQTGPNLPTASIAAQRRIDAALSRIFPESLLPVQVDSTQNFEEAIEQNVFPVAELLTVALTGKKGIPVYSRDMRRIAQSYTYSLHDILADYFVRHSTPRDIPRYISWLPTREYTGIVIYARGQLPVHGEKTQSPIAPCLFPELFDDAMNPLLLLEMADPAFLKRWGSAAYTYSFDEAPWKERIGSDPMRIIASGLYGKYPTDLKIDGEDAARILANAANRRLLVEGRILIIIDAE